MDTNIEEIWKDVVGYEGLYQISSHGRVKSFQPRWKKDRILRPLIGLYFFFTLTKNGVPKTNHLHRILMMAFKWVDGCENLTVNHKNGNKLDNRFENLEWCTTSENILHAFESGLTVAPKGSKRWNSILSEQDIPAIRKMNLEGVKIKSIASQYNVTEGAIYGITRGVTWRHVL